MIAIKSDTTAHTLYPFPAELISSRMQEVLLSDNPEIDRIIEYLSKNSGKMIRPRLVFLCASMSAHDPLVVTDVAVAVELIHLASLIHDDVIDNASIRRGQESMNHRWGNHASVLTGDYLFATAFNLINKHGMQDILENVTTTIRIMCAGEIKQMALAYDLNVTEDQYLEKTYGKTACLFASSCKVGAMASSMPPDSVHALEQFGLCLGYAYQIIDDLLDFLSDSSLLGKPVGNDLSQGNITLPVIHALKNRKYGALLKMMLVPQELTPQQISAVVEVLIDSGAVESSLNSAQQFVARGLNYLNALPANLSQKELQHMAALMLETYDQKLSPVHRKISRKLTRL